MQVMMLAALRANPVRTAVWSYEHLPVSCRASVGLLRVCQGRISKGAWQKHLMVQFQSVC